MRSPAREIIFNHTILASAQTCPLAWALGKNRLAGRGRILTVMNKTQSNKIKRIVGQVAIVVAGIIAAPVVVSWYKAALAKIKPA